MHPGYRPHGRVHFDTVPGFPSLGPTPGSMSDSRLILLCDHRGDGLSESLRPLRSVGLRIEESTGLAQTRDRLQRLQPDLLLLDPLSSGGVVEFEQV